MRDHHVVKPIPVSSLQYRPRNYFGRFDLQEKLDFFQGESEFYPCFDQTLRMMVEEG